MEKIRINEMKLKHIVQLYWFHSPTDLIIIAVSFKEFLSQMLYLATNRKGRSKNNAMSY